AEQLAGLHLADQILRDHRDELDLGAAGAGEHDHAGAELVAQLIAGVAQDLGVVGVDLCREHLDALDRARFGHEIAAAAGGDALLELLDLAIELLLLGEQLVDALAHLERRRLEAAAGLHQLVLELAQVLERAGTGDRLDAAHALRDARLADDLHQADVTRAANVGATAELDRLAADRHDAHLVAVLLAEHRDRALLLRLIDRQHLDDRVPVRADLGIDDVL